MRYVQRFTGPDPIDCGHFLFAPTREPRTTTFGASAGEGKFESVLPCLRSAVAERRPFLTVEEENWWIGHAGSAFSGLLGTGDGGIYSFSYDDTPCLRPGCLKTFSIRRCATLDGWMGLRRFTCDQP